MVIETAVDVGEVYARIETEAEAAANRLEQFQNDASVLRSLLDFAAVFHLAGREQIAGLLRQGFDVYRPKPRVREAALEANLSDIFRRYFEVRPPFETGKKGKKRCEFPDGFIISTHDACCRRNDQHLYLVTDDGGLREAAGETIRLLPIASLEEVVDLVVSDEHQALALAARRSSSESCSPCHLGRTSVGHGVEWLD